MKGKRDEVVTSTPLGENCAQTDTHTEMNSHYFIFTDDKRTNEQRQQTRKVKIGKSE